MNDARGHAEPTRVAVRVPELGLGRRNLWAGLWLVEVGEVVLAGDRLLELQAVGVTVDVPAPVEGTLRGPLVREGEAVAPGQILAWIEASPDAADAEE